MACLAHDAHDETMNRRAGGQETRRGNSAGRPAGQAGRLGRMDRETNPARGDGVRLPVRLRPCAPLRGAAEWGPPALHHAAWSTLHEQSINS